MPDSSTPRTKSRWPLVLLALATGGALLLGMAVFIQLQIQRRGLAL